MRILVICTANICRSPAAAAMLDRALSAAGVDAEVASAGFLTEGRGADPQMAKRCARIGLDLSDHVSRKVTADDLGAADLTVCMERAHARELVVLDPPSGPRIHTLRGLAAALDAQSATDPWQDTLGSIARRRPMEALLGDGVGDDDVADPYGRSWLRYRRAFRQIDDATGRIARWLAGAESP